MKMKPVNQRARKGLRRTLWELLTPQSTCFSPVIASFANMDFAAARKEVKIYQQGLTAMAIGACCFAWHKTMCGEGAYQMPVTQRLNRAERFLLNELLKFGHQVATYQLQQIGATPACQSSGSTNKVRHRAS